MDLFVYMDLHFLCFLLFLLDKYNRLDIYRMPKNPRHEVDGIDGDDGGHVDGNDTKRARHEIHPLILERLNVRDVPMNYEIGVEITQGMTEQEYASKLSLRHAAVITEESKKGIMRARGETLDTRTNKRKFLDSINKRVERIGASIMRFIDEPVTEEILQQGSFQKVVSTIASIPRKILSIPQVIQNSFDKRKKIFIYLSSHSSYPDENAVELQGDHAILYTAGAGYPYGEYNTELEEVLKKYMVLSYIFKQSRPIVELLQRAHGYVKEVFPNDFFTQDKQIPPCWLSEASVEYASKETIFYYDFNKADYFSYTGMLTIMLLDNIEELGIEDIDVYGPYNYGDRSTHTREIVNNFDLTIVENYAYFREKMMQRGIELPERLSDRVILFPTTGPRYDNIALSTLLEIATAFNRIPVIVIRACRSIDRVCTQSQIEKIGNFVYYSKRRPCWAFRRGGKSRHRHHKTMNQTRRRKHTKKRHRRRKNNIKFSRYSK
jgi:hypothetical protein